MGIPVDAVKPKSATTLQRERNLAADPQATLLVEHWDPADWSRLWWVRPELRAEPAPDRARVDDLAERLAARHHQYRERAAPFTRIIVLRIVGVTGWAASAG